METIVIIVLAAISLASLGVAVFFFLKGREAKPDNSFLLLQNHIEALREQLQNQFHRQGSSLNETRKAMDDRLDNAARVIGELQKSMGGIKDALTPVAEIRDILRAPKQRGGMGEIMLEQLLSEMIPSELYTMQYGFADGERVDAAIKFGGQMVPIDSKFPLEKYREYLKAPEGDAKKAYRRGVVSAVKKHIEDVAKYIRPDEGTYPFAFMYIPSEGIYYDLFVSPEADEAVWRQAANHRVFPVSSNTLYLYLETIAFGLRGMKVAEHARELLSRLDQLQKDLGVVRKNYQKIGTHLKNAQSAFDDTDKRLEKLEVKFTVIGSEAPAELAEPSKEKPAELVQ
jgi:DNA recombination protein RmuC